MRCISIGYGIEYDVEIVDQVYRSIQFNAEFMSINDGYVTLYFPFEDKINQWICIIDGKKYTSVVTNIFNDHFDNIIRSTKILLSNLNCYRTGWKIENSEVYGDICTYTIDKFCKITVLINKKMCDGNTRVNVYYDDKKEKYGQSAGCMSEREVIEQLNSIFDKYKMKKEAVKKEFELLTLDI